MDVYEGATLIDALGNTIEFEFAGEDRTAYDRLVGELGFRDRRDGFNYLTEETRPIAAALAFAD